MQRIVSRSIAAALAGVVAFRVVSTILGRRRTALPSGLFADDAPGPVEPDHRSGSSADRGRTTSYGLDVDRLRADQELRPVVEYLTYIQSQRGDGSHILFVRYDDLDRLARREGEEVDAFLQRLDQLGVVVSNN